MCRDYDATTIPHVKRCAHMSGHNATLLLHGQLRVAICNPFTQLAWFGNCQSIWAAWIGKCQSIRGAKCAVILLSFWWHLGNFREDLERGRILKPNRIGQPHVVFSLMASLIAFDQLLRQQKYYILLLVLVLYLSPQKYYCPYVILSIDFVPKTRIFRAKMLKLQCFLPFSQVWNLVSHFGTCIWLSRRFTPAQNVRVPFWAPHFGTAYLFARRIKWIIQSKISPPPCMGKV